MFKIEEMTQKDFLKLIGLFLFIFSSTFLCYKALDNSLTKEAMRKEYCQKEMRGSSGKIWLKCHMM